MLLTGITAAQQTSSTASESVKPAAAPGPTNNVRPAIKWNRSDYTCEGGAKFLQEDTPDGDGKKLVKGCVLDKPAEAAKP